MIKLQVIGNLGSDATLKEISGQGSVINFSVAHSEKTDRGEFTTWVKCAWWGGGEKVAPYLKTGTKVYVEGFPSTEHWKDSNGEAQSTLKMSVIRLELLGSKKEEV